MTANDGRHVINAWNCEHIQARTTFPIRTLICPLCAISRTVNDLHEPPPMDPTMPTPQDRPYVSADQTPRPTIGPCPTDGVCPSCREGRGHWNGAIYVPTREAALAATFACCCVGNYMCLGRGLDRGHCGSADECPSWPRCAEQNNKIRGVLTLSESAALPYDRKVLTTVLVYHQATNTSGCHCGWGALGHSHAEHVADVYEESVGQRMKAGFMYARGVRADGTTATYPIGGLFCSTCGEDSDYAVRVELSSRRPFTGRVEPATPVEVYLPCGHEVRLNPPAAPSDGEPGGTA